MLENLFTEQYRQLQCLRAELDTKRYVCFDSTPVLFFGELEKASILTVGIDPSWQEFLSDKDKPLTGIKRRFAHESDMSGNKSADAKLALHHMQAYFSTNPDIAYWQWFSPIEILVNSFGCSLKNGSAAHTDVVSCFATLPPWPQIAGINETIANKFAESGYEAFIKVLEAAPNVKRIFILGPTSRKTFQQKSGLEFKIVETPFDTVRKFSNFRPVLSEANWQRKFGINLQIVAVGPYWNRPLHPLTFVEIDSISRYL